MARPSHDGEIDPHKRFSPSGQILYRTRELSAALVGLRERLERPAASVEAFLWRLEGPFGPAEIATKLIEERRTNRSIPGEEPFMLAEIGLDVGQRRSGSGQPLYPGAANANASRGTRHDPFVGKAMRGR